MKNELLEHMLSALDDPVFLVKNEGIIYQNEAAIRFKKTHGLHFIEETKESDCQELLVLENNQNELQRWHIIRSIWKAEGEIYEQFVLRELIAESEVVSTAQQKQLMMYATNAYEMERKRISQELHDGIAQMIFSSQIALQNLRNADLTDKEREKLSSINTQLSDVLAEIRNIALDLRPAALGDLGLKAAIDSLVDRYIQLFGVDIHFISNLKRRMAESVELTLYRVVQEGLMNAIKYAKVLDIDVLLIEKKEQLTLEIIDLGEGFDPSQIVIQGSGLGLLNMKERVEALSGKFVLRSKKNQGTHIMVTIPLNQRGDEEC